MNFPLRALSKLYFSGPRLAPAELVATAGAVGAHVNWVGVDVLAMMGIRPTFWLVERADAEGVRSLVEQGWSRLERWRGQTVLSVAASSREVDFVGSICDLIRRGQLGVRPGDLDRAIVHALLANSEPAFEALAGAGASMARLGGIHSGALIRVHGGLLRRAVELGAGLPADICEMLELRVALGDT